MGCRSPGGLDETEVQPSSVQCECPGAMLGTLMICVSPQPSMSVMPDQPWSAYFHQLPRCQEQTDFTFPWVKIEFNDFLIQLEKKNCRAKTVNVSVILQ